MHKPIHSVLKSNLDPYFSIFSSYNYFHIFHLLLVPNHFSSCECLGFPWIFVCHIFHKIIKLFFWLCCEFFWFYFHVFLSGIFPHFLDLHWVSGFLFITEHSILCSWPLVFFWYFISIHFSETWFYFDFLILSMRQFYFCFVFLRRFLVMLALFLQRESGMVVPHIQWVSMPAAMHLENGWFTENSDWSEKS